MDMQCSVYMDVQRIIKYKASPKNKSCEIMYSKEVSVNLAGSEDLEHER